MNPKKTKIEPLSSGELSLGTIKETTDLLSGKWKLVIVGFLLGNGRTRFGDLLKRVEGRVLKNVLISIGNWGVIYQQYSK